MWKLEVGTEGGAECDDHISLRTFEVGMFQLIRPSFSRHFGAVFAKTRKVYLFIFFILCLDGQVEKRTIFVPNRHFSESFFFLRG